MKHKVVAALGPAHMCVVIRLVILPTAKNNADPFEGERSDGGVMRFAFCPLLFVMSFPFGGENFQTTLIACPLLSRSRPPCSVIRPTQTEGAAMGAVKFLTAMGLFIGQPRAFSELLQALATEADAAKHDGQD